MNDYLSKPIKAEELIEMVERLAAPAPGPGPHSLPSLSDQAPPPALGAGSAPAVELSPFDLQEGIRLCFHDDEMFRRLVALFFEEVDPLRVQMQAALEAGEGMELARTAHRLRGTLAYLGARPASDASSHLETLAMSGRLEAAAEALRQLDHELQRLSPALQPHREPSGSGW